MQQSIVVFRVADKEYGVPVELVHSVEQGVTVTAVPRTIAFIRGVFELRGDVIPLVDMRERLGQMDQVVLESGFVLVVEVNGDKTGFLVDEVNDVVPVDDEALEPVPRVIGGLEAEFIRGMARKGHRLLILLNLPQLLSDAELRQLKQLEESRKS
ncbi:chemotaxis protein CheW [Alicyclobacillus mengziensis]|uniref:Purine-binding chemotaxis protein CheW n=1 Tax=Alicyclobacillus mengziensis TaxID=2931921 RepID=A0A9X7Z5K1_9BACL|nr:chemotaxis protein CheW [Alicyclobacillus mengziensis]QSO45361.1 purine-binding chemotaxis protein CheW [Alicyclobacillus mengziensis]